MEEDIRVVSRDDPAYPALLKTIPGAPKKLYVRGTLGADEPRVAIVGTRLCSPYGKEIALRMGEDLARAGCTIVSGLAPGIDAYAHLGALRGKGKTIAVLGTGSDEKSIYPQENIALAKTIVAQGGALISEYPPGTSGSRFTFPQRNRIISGLSLAVVLVEAKEKSGSLITARYALRQKRVLCAFPGSVFSVNSRGTHGAIRSLGAKLVENAKDVLDLLGLKRTDRADDHEFLTDEERAVRAHLREEILHIDAIIERSKLPAQKVASILAILEIKGMVRNLGQHTYAISHR